MNTQTTANKLVQNFRQNGLARKHTSFFGQVLLGQPLFGQRRDATPQAAMLRAFHTAGLTVAEANFFGIPHNGYVKQPVTGPQPNVTPAQTLQIVAAWQRSNQAA